MKNFNYEIIQGDSWSASINYKQPSGNPVNLTGSSILMEIKDQPGGKILCATASVGTISSSGTVGDGISVTSPSSGWIYINLSSTKTKQFNMPQSAFQIQVTDTAGDKQTIHKGWFIMDAGVID